VTDHALLPLHLLEELLLFKYFLVLPMPFCNPLLGALPLLPELLHTPLPDSFQVIILEVIKFVKL
jgi:hypothetical protein